MNYRSKLSACSTTVCLGVFLSLPGCESSKEVSPAEKPAQPVAATPAPKTAPNSEPEAKAVVAGPRIKDAAAPEKLGAQSDEYGLKVGVKIPAAEATNSEGQKVKLESFTEKGPLLLIFYRGGWCPYCNFQIRAMAAAYEQLQARGVSLVMVSVDEVSESTKTNDSFKLPFPVLSDVSGSMHKAFGVYKKDKAVPSLFLLDQGKLRFSHVDEDYTKRPTAEQIELMLQELGYAKK